MAEMGYGEWEQLRLEIRSAWQFKFDWFLKSRTTEEIKRRCEVLVRLIEKEVFYLNPPPMLYIYYIYT